MNKSLVTNILAIAVIIIGLVSPIYANEIKTMGLYSFSGAITNWLAIHMLFEKVPYLYGSGVITERFVEFKQGIKNLVMTQFFTIENLRRFIESQTENTEKKITDEITSAIDMNKVFNKFKEAVLESSFGGMLGMFGGETALEPLRPHIEIKIKEMIEDLLNDSNFKDKLLGKNNSDQLLTNIQQVVEMRLNELTPKMVKNIVEEMIREHLGWLVVWGGVFGAVIGLISTLI